MPDDDWSMPLTGGLAAGVFDPPPLQDPENADPNSADWQQIIRDKQKDISKTVPPSPKNPQAVESSTEVREEEVIVSGKTPTAWERIGRKDEGDRDYILWQRTYPSISYQKYKVLTITFRLVTYAPMFALNVGKVVSSEILQTLEYWIRQGQPYKRQNQVHYVWEASSTRRKAADGTQTYIDITLPPREPAGAEFPGTPLPNGKWGDPKQELGVARAAFDSHGVHLTLGLRVRDRQGRPLEGVTVELEGSSAGETSTDGEIEFTTYVARPLEPFDPRNLVRSVKDEL